MSNQTRGSPLGFDPIERTNERTHANDDKRTRSSSDLTETTEMKVQSWVTRIMKHIKQSSVNEKRRKSGSSCHYISLHRVSRSKVISVFTSNVSTTSLDWNLFSKFNFWFIPVRKKLHFMCKILYKKSAHGIKVNIKHTILAHFEM
jgi:hypothetical protein